MDGMNWHPDGRLMFRTDIFRAVLEAEKTPTPGVKLTALQKLSGRSYGTLTQLFHELEDMVAKGQLYRDDVLANNTYRTKLTIDEYCQMTGESPMNFGLTTQEEIHKFCIRNSEDRCIQCRDYAPKKRVCPVYRVKQQQLKKQSKKKK
jgi:hypothetical protein